MNQNLAQKIALKSAHYLKRNSSTILTILSIAGVVATTVMAVDATPKAIELIKADSREKHDGDENAYTKLEAVKSCWKCYIPAAITGFTTITCIVGVNVLNQRAQASLASAYGLVSNSYNQYKSKLKELYGEEAHQNIVDSIVKEKVKDIHISSECLCSRNSLYEDNDESELRLFYDDYSGRYFESTMARVISAEYHLNRNFNLRGYTDTAEWYSFLGLDCDDASYLVGWSAYLMAEDGMKPWIEFNHRNVMLDENLSCCIIELPIGPVVGYLEEDEYDEHPDYPTE